MEYRKCGNYFAKVYGFVANNKLLTGKHLGLIAVI